MRHSHERFRARVCVQHPTYPPSIFSTARLMNAAGHVSYLLRAVMRVFILYLVLVLAVYVSAQLITPPPSGSEAPVYMSGWWGDHGVCSVYISCVTLSPYMAVRREQQCCSKDPIPHIPRTLHIWLAMCKHSLQLNHAAVSV